MAPRKSAVASNRPRAASLHIGLNAVSPAAYSGWSGELAACEFDANDMAALARSRSMVPLVLLTKKATRAAVLAGLRRAASTLKGGDFFFLSYSGHGGQLPDTSGDEADKLDETWCLFDGQLIDDELYVELARFAAGVRVLVLSDSCHSGTVTRAALPPPDANPSLRPRLMPPSVAMRVYREHQAFYDKLQAEVAVENERAAVDPDTALAQLAVSNRLTAIVSRFEAAVILISGCQDNQTAMDGAHNGAFTEKLLLVWKDGRFSGNYAMLHSRTRSLLPPTQSPNLFTLGPAGAFLKQQPFSL